MSMVVNSTWSAETPKLEGFFAPDIHPICDNIPEYKWNITSCSCLSELFDCKVSGVARNIRLLHAWLAKKLHWWLDLKFVSVKNYLKFVSSSILQQSISGSGRLSKIAVWSQSSVITVIPLIWPYVVVINFFGKIDIFFWPKILCTVLFSSKQ